jgi:DnaJ-class molecular chaperone
VSSNDYYKVLGVDRAESAQGIHSAYRRLAKQCHPDLVGGHSKEQFQGVQEAYEVLSDPDKRKSYDASIDNGRRRTKSGIEPEPLVSSPNRSRRFTYPEPLIRNSSPIEDLFSSLSGDGSFSNRSKIALEDVYPFPHAFEVLEDRILHFLLSYAQRFRTERF